MPLNLPNTWGVKKTWKSPIPPTRDIPEEDEEEDEDRIINDDGQMRCPRCNEWVDYFDYTGSSTEFGHVDSTGDLDARDSEFNGVDEILCPHCSRVVFHSTSELRRHYGTD